MDTLLYDGNGFTAAAGPVLGIGGLADPPPAGPADNVDGYEARGSSAVVRCAPANSKNSRVAR